MTDWPNVTVPCRGNPDLWESPAAVTRPALDVVYRDVLTAVEMCRTCPALEACAQWAVLHPPQNTVQAAMVYSHDRKPRRPGHWRENVINRNKWKTFVEKRGAA